MSGFSKLEGETIVSIKQEGEISLTITCKSGNTYFMFGDDGGDGNDVYVWLEDVVGDFEDVLGSKVLLAEVRTNKGKESWESTTWTFYTIRTTKGSVDLRWCGRSNGYYCEEVNFSGEDKSGKLL